MTTYSVGVPADTVEVPSLMTTGEVARLLRVDPSTLSRWRASGLGPRVTWLSPLLPRYRRGDVLAWLEHGVS